MSRPRNQSSDECVYACRGMPLHTRCTRRNKVLIKTFRELLFKEVLSNLRIHLDPDVISIIVLYTFERTHPFVPHSRVERRRSLTRDEDILDLLRPCDPDFEPNRSEDYTLRKLIGRTLYGFDIHDSPYTGVKHPNPCEIMTDDGGLFLVPDMLSDWFLNQDGNCVPLPVRYRFKHRIADAKIKFRATGSYLQLTIIPVRGVIPGTDELFRRLTMESPCVVEDSDAESSAMYDIADIDSNLLRQRRSSTDDSLALEIARSWECSRESVLVFGPQSAEVGIPAEVEDCKLEEPVQQLRVLKQPDLELSACESSDSLDFQLDIPAKLDTKNDEKKQVDEYLTASEYQIRKDAVLLRRRENTKTSSFANTEQGTPSTSFGSIPTTCTSLGSVPLENCLQNELTLETPEKEQNTSFSTRVRPSIVAHSTSEICVLELGAGFVGIQDLSLSFLHYKVTPNPGDSSLDSFDLDIGE